MTKNLYISAIFTLAVFISSACSSSANVAGGGGQTANSANSANTNSTAAQNDSNVNKPKVENKQTKPADEFPKFGKGENYKAVREKLIKSGWTPFKSKDAQECGEGDERCQDFPEMEACAGTGLANCRYLWKKGGQTLAIFTVGELPAYSGHEFVKAANQNKADKEDTAWKGGALVHSPPTNVRESPDGRILCVIKEEKQITLNGSTNITDENGEWIRTNACGKPGVIHSSQINIVN